MPINLIFQDTSEETKGYFKEQNVIVLFLNYML